MLRGLIDRRIFANYDYLLLSSILSIPAVGLFVLYSAGYNPDISITLFSGFPITVQSLAFAKQLTFFSAGLFVMILVSLVDTQVFYKWAYVFYSICLFLLFAVLVIGTVSKGARRWIDLGPIFFQPAEPMKLALIFALAKYLSRNLPARGGYGFKSMLIPFLLFVVPAGLIMRQPDLGTGLVVMGTGGLMLLFVGIKKRTLLLLITACLIGVFPAWHMLHDYQKNRIISLIDPMSDPKGTGYHIIQSKIAVGSGQFLGKGFLKGTQTQLSFLPEHTTDFVFSVLAEEWGFVGCLLVLGLYLSLMLLLIRVIQRSTNTFMALVTVGVGANLFIHIVVNIGMVSGILPVVGITLPLFSYGGSALLSFMISLGIVLGISMRRWLFRGNDL